MAKKYSYWINSGKYSMLQKIFVILFGVLAFMILARVLTTGALGVWGLFLIISSIVETLRNALIRNGYVLFIHTREEKDHPGIEYAAIITNIIYSLLFIIVFLIAGPLIEKLLNAPGLTTLLNFYCITLLVLIPFSYLEISQVTRSDFRAVFWMYFVRNGSMLAGYAFFAFSGLVPLSFVLLAAIYGASALLGLIAGIMSARDYKMPDVKRDASILPAFIKFGKYVFSNNLFSLIFRSTDSFITSSFISPAASAYYSTCARITNLVDMPSQVFADIMFPRAAQVMKSNDKQGLKRIYEKTVAATLTFTIPAIIVILIVPGYILYFLAGSEYVKAAPILQVIVFYGFFLPFIKQFGNVMDVLNKPQINSLVMFIFASLNIILNIVGIHFFGLYGAAYATLTSYVLLFITTQIILTKLLNISRINILRNTLGFYPEYLRLAKGFLSNRYNPR